MVGAAGECQFFFYKIVALVREEGLDVKAWLSFSGGNSTVAIGYSVLQ